MNCHCQPGQVAVLRKSSKNNENFGKEFYCCPTSSCHFFHWADSKVPPTLHPRNPASHRPADSFRNNNRPFQQNQSNQTAPSNIYNAKFSLVSYKNNTFYVGLTCPYHASVYAFMQSHPEECQYDHGLKMWTFDLKIYDKVVPVLKQAEFQPEELPRFLTEGIKKYLNKIRKPLGHPMEIEEPNLTPSLKHLLLPFQMEGIKFIINHGGRGLIGDEMGCGKTVQAIALLQHYRTQWPALILMPTNLANQWEGELLKYCSELLTPRDICQVKSGKDAIYGKIVLIPYSLIDKFIDREVIVPERFGMVIADESHKLKNNETKTATNVVPLLKSIPIAICLSGTPMLNRPVELYTQLHGLLPTVFYDFLGFAKRYCNSKLNDFGKWDHNGSSNQVELKLLLDSLVMVRRLKQEVIDQLPQKHREIIYVEVDPKYAGEIARIQKQQSLLDSALKTAGPEKSLEERQKLSQQKDQLLLHYYQMTGLAKISAIKDHILQLIESARLDKVIEESKLERGEGDEQAEIPLSFEEYHSPAKGEGKMIDLVNECNDLRQTSKIPPQAKKEDDRASLDAAILIDTDDEADATGALLPQTSSISPAKKKKVTTKLQSSHTRRKGIDPKDDEDDDRTIELLDDDDDSSSRETEEETYASYDNDPDYEEEGDEEDDEEEEEDEEIDFDDQDLYFKADESKSKKRRSGSTASSSNKKKKTNDTSSRNNKNKKKQKQKTLDEMEESEYNPALLDMLESKEQQLLQQQKKKVLRRKILLFAHHRAVLDAMEDVLREVRVKYIRVDGNVTTSKKSKLIAQFQTDEETDIALLSITACGTGLNLTRASIAVFAELNWSPGVNGQAEDRIHRLGQTSSEVRIIYILAKNTSDDIVWELIQRKSSTIGATIGNAERSMKILERVGGGGGGAEEKKKKGATVDPSSSSSSTSSFIIDNNAHPLVSKAAKGIGSSQTGQQNLDRFITTTTTTNNNSGSGSALQPHQSQATISIPLPLSPPGSPPGNTISINVTVYPTTTTAAAMTAPSSAGYYLTTTTTNTSAPSELFSSNNGASSIMTSAAPPYSSSSSIGMMTGYPPSSAPSSGPVVSTYSNNPHPNPTPNPYTSITTSNSQSNNYSYATNTYPNTGGYPPLPSVNSQSYPPIPSTTTNPPSNTSYNTSSSSSTATHYYGALSSAPTSSSAPLYPPSTNSNNRNSSCNAAAAPPPPQLVPYRPVVVAGDSSNALAIPSQYQQYQQYPPRPPTIITTATTTSGYQNNNSSGSSQSYPPRASGYPPPSSHPYQTNSNSSTTATTSRSSYHPTPSAPTRPALVAPSSPTPFHQNQRDIPTTTAASYISNSSSGRAPPPLTPEKLAQIEKNRLEAQKRLAMTRARQQQQQQQQQQHLPPRPPLPAGYPAHTTSQGYPPSAPSMMPSQHSPYKPSR